MNLWDTFWLSWLVLYALCFAWDALHKFESPLQPGDCIWQSGVGAAVVTTIGWMVTA